MSEMPPYPPPPSLPPEPETPPAESEPPPPAPYTSSSSPPAPYAPSPEYAAPVQGYAPQYGYPAVPPQPRSSRHLRTMIVGGILIVVLLLAIMGYVFAGYVYASSRISVAAGAISKLDSHRSYVNTTLDLLEQQAATIGTQTDGSVGKATATSMVTESQGLRSSLDSDDKGLVASRTNLSDQQWLTSLSQGRLAAETVRIDHGRKAITTVKAGAADYAFLGQFLADYFQAIADLNLLISAASANDLVGTAGADASLQNDLTKALQSSTNVAGLPTELHDRLIDLQTYALDFGKLVNARDQASFDAADKALAADAAKLRAYDPAAPVAKIKTYFQHYRVDFNLEMDKATA